MRQTRTDTSIAIVQAVLLHALLFALMFAGLQWSRSSVPLSAEGEPVEADLVTMSDLSASMQRALKRPVKEETPAPTPKPEPKPLPEPLPEEVPAPKELPPPVPEPAPVEQERVQRNAEAPPVKKVTKEQEEKRKQPPQVELNAKNKQSALERQKQQQLEEIRKLREQASKDRSMAEQRAQQQVDARGTKQTPSPGNRGTDPSLSAKYAAALQQAILRQWTRPETVPLGQRCRISIRQIPGGEVTDVDISPTCPFDALGRRSVEAAVLKASPLPYAGFENVFNRNLELNFVAEDR